VTNATEASAPTPEPAEAAQSIGRQAGRGLRWSVLGTMATKVGSFAMALVLARLLTPSDFGTFAIALAASTFVMHVNDVGLIAATVQWRGKLEDMAPTAATLAVIFSVLIYGAFFFAAPEFAGMARIPEATPVIRLLTVVILIDGVTAVRSAALMRTFRQDKLILANVAGFVVNAALAIGLAAGGAGAISFAAGQVAGALVTGVLVFGAARLPVRVGFDSAVARRLMRFGVPLAASLGVEALLMNADKVIVGRFMGATALGFYLLAFNVSSWVPGVIGTAVRYVSVAGFSRLSEEDSESLSTGVRRSVPLLVTALVPIAVLISVLAVPLVSVLYGRSWLPAAPVLQYLMVLTVVRMLTSFALDILMGAGATRWTLWVNLGWALALVPALWWGTNLDGIRGAAISHAIVGLVVALPLAMLALHNSGVRLAPIAPALVRPLLGGVAATVVSLLLARLVGPQPFVQLAVAGCAGLLAYMVTALSRDQLRQWSAVLRRGRPHAVAE
jgi:PST family polysaccharide transporter